MLLMALSLKRRKAILVMVVRGRAFGVIQCHFIAAARTNGRQSLSIGGGVLGNFLRQIGKAGFGRLQIAPKQSHGCTGVTNGAR